MSLMLKRSSIRSYLDKEVPKELVTKLLQAAMQAPSARNQQPWDFIVVDKRELLDELSKASNGAWMLKDAPLAIIPMIRPTDKSPHFAQQDLAAATENILLECTNNGLGAVWIGVYPLEERVSFVEKAIGITGDIHPFCMIAIGYPKEEKEIKLRYDEGRIKYNSWEE